MYGWYFGRKLKNRYVTFVWIDRYFELFKTLANDNSVPRMATNLVYIVKANIPGQVESKVIQSIFHKQPKRAKKYWFVHIDRRDEPDTFEYRVTYLIPEVLIRIDLYLGFKVEPKINLYFREILEDLSGSGEINLESSYDTLRKYSFPSDFIYVLIDRVMIRDYQLSNSENLTLGLHNISRLICISDIKALQLDTTNTIEEKVPISVNQPKNGRITRVFKKEMNLQTQ
ncbi:MAG: hypothetical protein A2X04_06460 [Bacteroidetes bacterium GWF2_41_9]|nr:MAG: hypothetical protein A2X04_06460 [Bacteroidetes bacterium GWF2_41_9]